MRLPMAGLAALVASTLPAQSEVPVLGRTSAEGPQKEAPQKETPLRDTPQIADGKPRFLSVSPLPGLAPIMLDREMMFDGPTKIVAQRANLQARVLWIDATANIS
ncbi:hypothetical protein EON77_04760, partial [bacterium]